MAFATGGIEQCGQPNHEQVFCMTALPDVFLSYNREDQARAKLFAEAFEREGFKVWWDVGPRTGEEAR